MSTAHLLMDAIIYTLAILGVIVAWQSEKRHD